MFAQLGQPQSIEKLKDSILSGLNKDRKPLILALALTVRSMTMEDLTSLLLIQAAQKVYRKSRSNLLLSNLDRKLL